MKLAYLDGSMSISTEDRRLLERWLKAPTTPQRVVRRSRIVLLAADGQRVHEIAATLGISRPTVRLWLDRFKTRGAQALLHDAPGRGRPASIDRQIARDRLQAANLLDATGHPVSLRRASAFLQVSPSAVWRAFHHVHAPKAAD
jgi:transposase